MVLYCPCTAVYNFPLFGSASSFAVGFSYSPLNIIRSQFMCNMCKLWIWTAWKWWTWNYSNIRHCDVFYINWLHLAFINFLFIWFNSIQYNEYWESRHLDSQWIPGLCKISSARQCLCSHNCSLFQIDATHARPELKCKTYDGNWWHGCVFSGNDVESGLFSSGVEEILSCRHPFDGICYNRYCTNSPN